MKDALENLMGQKVEVIYEGIVYRGVLVAATDDEIHLQTVLEWISLPLEGIATVKKAEK
jgi:hypothetical protein